MSIAGTCKKSSYASSFCSGYDMWIPRLYL
jgi:hypothetical protein